jgi:radical SAM protein with 4Fe4S-binding SPASM domain
VKNNTFIPSSVVLELTYRCNHRCLFCSCPWEAQAENAPNYEKGEELHFEDWVKVLDKLYLLGVKNISISGGEALLKDCLVDLLDYIRHKNVYNKDVSIVIISNGLLMNDEFLKAFKKYNVHLSLSLPGLETFERHTGIDNVSGVLHWLGEAKKTGIATTVNVTVTGINHDELYETVANGLLAGADTVLLNRFLAGGRGLSYMKELSLTRKQLNEMLDTVEEILQISNRTGWVGTEFPRCVINDISKYQRLKIGSLCAAAKTFFVIDPAGWVRACNHSPRKVGHIFNDPIISDTDYWSAFTDRAYIPAGCVMCKDVNYCDCGCRETASILYGSICAKDPCLINI